MTAAILQGVPATTLDADLWIDLPERQYIRVLNLCKKLGAKVIANTVVALTDDTLVNFHYRVDGVASFETESRRVVTVASLRSTLNTTPPPAPAHGRPCRFTRGRLPARLRHKAPPHIHADRVYVVASTCNAGGKNHSELPEEALVAVCKIADVRSPAHDHRKAVEAEAKCEPGLNARAWSARHPANASRIPLPKFNFPQLTPPLA